MTAPELSYRDELLGVVKDAINAHPRSQQKVIGPSEIGTPCDRKLGFKLAASGRSNPLDDAPWRPTVGTAVHAWLTDAFLLANAAYPPHKPRWILDTRVPVGEIDGQTISGALDLYDAYKYAIIDWKIPGPSSIKAKKAKRHPGEQYRKQVQLYGRGAMALGMRVDTVAVLFMPSAGELTDSYYWSEPYSEAVALEALHRANSIAVALRLAGRDKVIPELPTTADFCNRCAYWRPGSARHLDLTRQCPGADESRPIGEQFLDIVGTPS